MSAIDTISIMLVLITQVSGLAAAYFLGKSHAYRQAADVLNDIYRERMREVACALKGEPYIPQPRSSERTFL